jgi:flavin reductase (DIM6/NTAB) family NADH-FMN oxidoreductase RutF
MKHFTKKNILEMDKVKRLNIVNSITGIKPGNLIGTISNDNFPNLAIFSSIVHLGSNPALLGFILRPQHKVRRDTYDNILENGSYTVNHLPNHLTKNGHYTSVKFDKNQSEFEYCNFKKYYIDGFKAPFVKESNLSIGMKFMESIPIKANNTVMVVGCVEHVLVNEDALSDEGYIDLEILKSSGISGLNSYYKLTKIDSYPYARISELHDFKK